MRRLLSVTATLLLSISSVMLGQSPAPGLAITNYLLVSQQPAAGTFTAMTYRATLSNPGPALNSVTATVTSLTANVQVVPGQDTLHFSPVPARTEVGSNDTFTILVDRTHPFDLSSLSWTFRISQNQPPIASAGSDQSAKVGQTVTLNGSGSSNPSGIGTLTYQWTFTSLPPGSAAVLSNPTSVMPTFVPDLAGDYIVTLTVSNGVDSATATTKVSTTKPPAPVANAGPGQMVAVGSTVVLNGGGSTSGSGNPLTYAWTLISVPAGSTAKLSGANTVSPTFVADKSGNYVAQLVVNDGVANSLPSTVTISTLPVRPVANAGPSQVVSVNSVVQLNGAGSTDASGLPLTYQWTLISVPPGSAAVLSNPTAVNPTFTADRPGTYVAQLIVNNGVLSSIPATVAISSNSPLGPVANAGVNQNVQLGTTVQLNGSGSDPQNLPLTYQWVLLNKPAGGTATLSSTVIPNPTFVADQPGTYVAQLIVNNGFLSSAASTVTISTLCAPPTANAGPNQNANVGATVTLDGSASGDPCHGQLTYSWTFNSRPEGSNATLAGANTAAPSFVLDVPGTYVAQLIVSNGVTSSNPATVTITTLTSDIILPASLTVQPGQTVPFSVALAKPAPDGGVIVTLTSSDPSKVGVSPTNVLIRAGQTTSSQPKLTGVSLGSATITASAFGLAPSTMSVQVVSGALTFVPGSLTITGAATQNLTLALTPSSPTAVTVTLSSSNPAVATVPATITIPVNAASVAVPVTAVGSGSTVIHASAPNIADTTAKVDVVFSSQISLPSNVSVGLGQSASFPILLSTPASADLTISLTSSDTSRVTVPASVVILKGQTTPSPLPQVTGAGVGSATITASAPGFNSVSAPVQVTASISFAGPLSTNVGSAANLILNLVGGQAPPGGLSLTLTSSNPNVASVIPSVTVPSGQSSVPVPIIGLAPGTTTITASSPNIASTSAVVTVSQSSITLQSGIVIPVGGAAPITLTLSAPAPAPVTVTLGSSDPSKATVSTTVTIPAGSTTPTLQPVVSGVGAGAAVITATAPGYTTGTQTVQVTSGSTLSFTPGGLTINPPFPNVQTLTLSLSPAPQGVLTLSLSSTNPSAVTVPSTVTFLPGQTSVPVQVTAVGPGSATITASGVGFSASANITASAPCSNCIMVGSVSVGQNLQTLLSVTIPGVTVPAGGITVTLVSSDPNKVLLDAVGMNQAKVTINPGTNTAFVLVQGLDKQGSATITGSAGGFVSGSGTVTLTPSGFVLAGPNGIGQPFSLGVGAQTALTVSSARLDSSMNFVEVQPVRSGPAVTVNLTSSTPSVGTIKPTSVTFTAGDSSKNAIFQSLATGSSTLSASVPPGFSIPGQGANQVVATVNTPSLSPSDATVGQGLEATATVALSGTTITQTPLTLTSSDPSRLLLSATPNGVGSASITLQVPAVANTSQTFYLYGLGKTGTVQYTASAPGFNTGTGTVTLAPSGFVISGPGGISSSDFLTTPQAGDTQITVSSALLNQSNLFVAVQPLAGNGSVSVNVTSSNPAIGTVSPTPVNIVGGTSSAKTSFHPVSTGFTNLSVSTPAGFTTPANRTSVSAQVVDQSVSITGGVVIGQGLETSGLLTLPAPVSSDLVVTLTSNSPALLGLSNTAVAPASQSIAVVIPAGSSSAPYWLQGFGNTGSATYTASAPGYASRSATVFLARSGVVIAGPLGLGIFNGKPFPDNISLAAGPAPLTVSVGILDSNTGAFSSTQQLAGSVGPLVITLDNSDPSVGTVPSQVTLTPGNDSVNVIFTPLKLGTAIISVETPAGFTTPSGFTFVEVNVRP